MWANRAFQPSFDQKRYQLCGVGFKFRLDHLYVHYAQLDKQEHLFH